MLVDPTRWKKPVLARGAGGDSSEDRVSWKRRIEHPDTWLLPIPPLAGPDGDESAGPEANEVELVLAGGGAGTESGNAQSSRP